MFPEEPLLWVTGGVNKPNCTASGGTGSAKILVVPQIQNTYGYYDVRVDLQPQADNSFNLYVTEHHTPSTRFKSMLLIWVHGGRFTLPAIQPSYMEQQLVTWE